MPGRTGLPLERRGGCLRPAPPDSPAFVGCRLHARTAARGTTRVEVASPPARRTRHRVRVCPPRSGEADGTFRDVIRGNRAIDRVARRTWRVASAVPVLLFGDLDAYRASSPRVLTVGLHRCREELPADCPFLGCPLAEVELSGGQGNQPKPPSCHHPAPDHGPSCLCRPRPMRTPKEIRSEIVAVEREAEGLLAVPCWGGDAGVESLPVPMSQRALTGRKRGDPPGVAAHPDGRGIMRCATTCNRGRRDGGRHTVDRAWSAQVLRWGLISAVLAGCQCRLGRGGVGAPVHGGPSRSRQTGTWANTGRRSAGREVA